MREVEFFFTNVREVERNLSLEIHAGRKPNQQELLPQSAIILY
jgi:hypothetical protein